MRFMAATGRNGAVALALLTLAIGLTACADAPDLERLAPTMPKLSVEVPDSAHPEETAHSEFPNINRTPDRPSVMHSEDEIKKIEKSLEDDGQSHVKQAVGQITGKSPEEVEKELEAEKKQAPKKKENEKAKPNNKPLQLTPPS